MCETPPLPHLPWLDLWQYSTGLPLVLAGPFGPLMACGLPPTEWVSLLNTYALLPTAVATSLIQQADDTP
jgi:hypothetical protein